LEEQFVGLTAGFSVVSEERSQVALQIQRTGRQRRPATEFSQRERHEQVFGAAFPNLLPFV
jgi:hypothetical protein